MNKLVIIIPRNQNYLTFQFELITKLQEPNKCDHFKSSYRFFHLS